MCIYWTASKNMYSFANELHMSASGKCFGFSLWCPASLSGPGEKAEQIGIDLAQQLVDQGAAELLAR